MFVFVCYAQNGFRRFKNRAEFYKFGYQPEISSIHNNKPPCQLLVNLSKKTNRFPNRQRGCKDNPVFTASAENLSCPSSITPTRLADGLKAKKSSSEIQMRPTSLVPPCCIRQLRRH